MLSMCRVRIAGVSAGRFKPNGFPAGGDGKGSAIYGMMPGMRVSRAFRILLLALGLSLPVLAAIGPVREDPQRTQGLAASQDPEGTQPRRSGPATFTDELQVSWVLVPVVVRSTGGYVGELTREAFRLSVDGRPVAIESFDSSHDAATSLVWLQDVSGSMANGGKLEASRAAFRYFNERAHPEDEVAIATFAGGLIEVEVPFTSDGEALLEAAERWRGYGTTTLHDAVAFLPEISDQGRHRKRAVVLVTDGVDNASVLSPAESRLIVRQARLPVYVLGFTTADPRDLRRLDLSEPDEGDGEEDLEESFHFARLLHRLARASGGRFLWVTDPAEIEHGAAAVLDELRHQYVLGFPARETPREYREIEVEVEHRRKAEILHREGYYGGLPAPGS